MNNTGTYKVIDGKVVKVSDRVPVLHKVPNWARKMDPVGEQQRVYNNLTPQQIRKEEASI